MGNVPGCLLNRGAVLVQLRLLAVIARSNRLLAVRMFFELLRKKLAMLPLLPALPLLRLLQPRARVAQVAQWRFFSYIGSRQFDT